MNILTALLGLAADYRHSRRRVIEHPIERQPISPAFVAKPRAKRRRFPKSVPAGYWQQQAPIEHMHSKARMRALNSAAV